MNIYVLDSNPVMAARYHCDKHVQKMLVQSVHILCTVHHRHPHKNNYHLIKKYLYKSFQPTNHFVIWASYDVAHYLWLLAFAQELRNEYLRRFKKTTKAMALLVLLAKYLPKLPICDLHMPDWFEMAESMPPECVVMIDSNDYVVSPNGRLIKRNIDTINYFVDVVETYRNFYHLNHRHSALWDNGLNKPEWFQIKENF